MVDITKITDKDRAESYYNVFKDSVYEIYKDQYRLVENRVIKPKHILQNEKIDIALAIKQLNEYQKELKNRADITLSRSEQKSCFEMIENSKQLQKRLNDVINKLCELEK